MADKCKGCSRKFYSGLIEYRAHICKICGEAYCFKCMHGYVCIDCLLKVKNPKVRNLYDLLIYGDFCLIILSFALLCYALFHFTPLLPTNSIVVFAFGLPITWGLIFGVGSLIFQRQLVKMIEIDIGKPKIPSRFEIN